MAWYDGLFTPTMTPERQVMLDQAGNPVDPNAMAGAGVEGAIEALTDPEAYIGALSMLPAGRAATGGAPNWVWGGAGKGGRGAPSWRWGAEGPSGPIGPNRGGGALPPPPGKGGLPATQGGLPATQGGLPATQGGLPALSMNGLPAIISREGLDAATKSAAGGIGRVPLWLAALGGGGALMVNDFGPEEDVLPPPSNIPVREEGPGRTRGPNPWDALIQRNAQIGSGDMREFQTLNPINYSSMARPDYEAAKQVLAETGPVAPQEESFIQKLDDWLIPAIGYGLLGGPLGMIAGGFMGEGARQDRSQAEQAAFIEALNQDKRNLAQFDLDAASDTRTMDIEDATGQREAQIQDENFMQGQRAERREEDRYVRDSASAAQNMVLQALQSMRIGQQLEAGNMYLDGLVGGAGSQMSGSDIMDTLIQYAPQLGQQLQQDPTYMQATDPLTRAAAVEAFIMRLSADPQWQPYIEQIRQQGQMSDMQSFFN